MKDLKNQNIEKHGDPGPFLVCATTSLPKGDHKGGFVSLCFKCGASVQVPEKEMTNWRDYGALVVCPECSGGTIGKILETF